MRIIRVGILAAGFLLSSVPGFSATTSSAFSYVSPLPNAANVPSRTTLIFRPLAPLAQSDWTAEVSVTGEKSGVHAGEWIRSTDGRTVIFKPYERFHAGETVSVRVARPRGADIDFSFRVAPERRMEPVDHTPLLCSCVAGTDAPAPTAVRGDTPSRPESQAAAPFMLPADFPAISVTSNNPSPGYVFLANFSFGMPPDTVTSFYQMILDNDGVPVYFRRAPQGRFILDFKVQPDGRLSYYVFGSNHYYLMDNTYTVVDSVEAVGFITDIHELQVLPNGHMLLMGYYRRPVDMSQIVPGGNPDAVLAEYVVRELDLDKNVIFEWRTEDHFDVLDATNEDLTEETIDYAHPNALDLDSDGNILMSSRHMDEVTKIDRDTGEVIWRLGGKNNQFTLVGGGEWFSHQHDCRRQDSGTLSVFDNGNLKSSPESRAVEYELDETSHEIRQVWEYRHTPEQFGSAMGNAQRLDTGGTVIGWGNTNPNVTEIHADGSTAFELTFAKGYFTYRAFRQSWSGVASQPRLWARTDGDALMLYFTKFGDDDVAEYDIYRGSEPEPIERAATVAGNQFQVTNFNAGETLHFRVKARGNDGSESPFSNEIAVTPDFSNEALVAVLEIQPRNLNAKSKGKWINARFEVDCGCDLPNLSADAFVLNGVVPATRAVRHGGGRGETATWNLKFARAAVLSALTPGDVVELTVAVNVDGFMIVGTDRVRLTGPTLATSEATDRFELRQNAPNPFNPVTVIPFTVPAGSGEATLRIFDVAGRLVREFHPDAREGRQSVVWDGRDARGQPVSSGLYFYRLDAAGLTETRKMILMK